MRQPRLRRRWVCAGRGDFGDTGFTGLAAAAFVAVAIALALSTLWFREWRGQLGLDIIGQVFDGRAVGTEVIRACGTQHLI